MQKLAQTKDENANQEKNDAPSQEAFNNCNIQLLSSFGCVSQVGCFRARLCEFESGSVW